MSTPPRPEQSQEDLPTAILLSDLSIETLEVLQHFGIEAPHKLNEFAMSLEDALIEQVGKNQEAYQEIARLQKLLTEHNIPYETHAQSDPPV